MIKERIEKEKTAINNHMFSDIKKIDDALDTLHYMLFESGD
jgi:hypothetical protein